MAQEVRRGEGLLAMKASHALLLVFQSSCLPHLDNSVSSNERKSNQYHLGQFVVGTES